MTAKCFDYILFLTAIILNGLGILILSSVSAAYSMDKFGYPDYFLKHQMIFGLMAGAIFGTILFKIPLSFIKKIAFYLFLGNLCALGLVLFSKIGLKLIDASRWLDLGFLAVQPSELLKLTFIIYLSALLSRDFSREGFRGSPDSKRGLKDRTRALFPFLPFLIILAVMAFFLILQPDIGTLSIITAIGMVIYFGSKTPLWHIVLIGSCVLTGLFILIKAAPYRLHRLLVFLDPKFDPMGKGYQITQALIAIGSGGIFGVGLGLSRQKFGFLPQTIGDAVFPIFAEEAGFLGAMVLISLFLILVWRGFIISKQTSDYFSQLLALGISSWFGLQALVNICALSGLLPLTGIPLPFVSYGGSHLAAELGGLGLLLNISKNRRP